MLCCSAVTVVSKDRVLNTSTVGDGGTGRGASYEWFVGMLDAALAATTAASSALTANEADADVVRQVAVLFHMTKLAVNVVGRGTSAASSLLGLSARCYKEQFAEKVAYQQGLVSDCNK